MNNALVELHPAIQDYESKDQQTWHKVQAKLFAVQDRFAFEGYKACREQILSDGRSGVPQPAEVSRRLCERTGFTICPVNGTVRLREFFECLRQGRFTAMTKVRQPEEWHFCSSPDWIHECVGHATSLGDIRVANLYRQFGEAAARFPTKQMLGRLRRLYWYAFEVGLVRERGQVKAFGAAILSSLGEMQNVRRAELQPFNPVKVEAAAYNYQKMQATYFVAESTDKLLADLSTHLDSIKES